MARPIEILETCLAEMAELEFRVRAGTTSQRDCLRARIVLPRHQGLKQSDVAKRLGVSVVCASKWSSRCEAEGIAGLHGRDRRPTISAEKLERIIAQATQALPGR